MAGHGPPPKNPDEVRRRNASAEMSVVAPTGDVYGPELPADFRWPAATLAWWETWRRSPQAQLFTDTDWSFLLDTAVLHAEFWLGDRKLAAELRLRAAKFGATPEDRARLKVEVGDPPEPAVPGAPRPRERGRRERLLKAVGDDQ